MIKVIGTGSKGNSYLLTTEKETLILECGLNIKDIKKALNFDLSKVVGCLVTHSHNDHCKAIQEILKFTDVYTSKGTKGELETRFTLNRRCYGINHNKSFKVGNFIVTPFNVEHDTKEPLGFLIYHSEIGKVLFITDTYYLKYKFTGVDHILIECNYSEDILDTLEPYRARLLKSHMSLETLKEALKTWELSKTKEIILIHMSEGHGDKERFEKEISELTGIKTFVAVPGLEISK